MLWFGGFRFFGIDPITYTKLVVGGLAAEIYMTSGLLYTRGGGGENTGKQNRKMDPGK